VVIQRYENKVYTRRSVENGVIRKSEGFHQEYSEEASHVFPANTYFKNNPLFTLWVKRTSQGHPAYFFYLACVTLRLSRNILIMPEAKSMAKKKASNKTDRSSPKSNKSEAVRLMLQRMPNASAPEIASAVKAEYGHSISKNLIYMVKTKSNMRSDGRPKKSKTSKSSPMNSAALWVDAIKMARQLLKATGSVANATALLKAIDDK
jgi:hypothetical protein